MVDERPQRRSLGLGGLTMPSPLKSTKAITVSAPALAPGSTIVPLPVASSVTVPLRGLAPVIWKFKVRPAYGTPAVLVAVAWKSIGTP